MSRVVTRSYGTTLVVHFASRFDQIHFKLFALVDQGGGRHEADLRALHPTRGELTAAARWSITQDPSPADTAESEYLIASQARSLMSRLTRDLEAAEIDIPHRQPAHGAAYLPVFAETSNALLARLGVAR
ncbi:MAG: hypothetical protein JWM19_4583 [Actinomycetia bacterium]|nr:hypothetical protein [Actinomycetes bacterium]